jgi:hypothetical protein
VTKDEALGHVAGYSLFDDGSVRDFQMKSQQWTMGKSFDGTGAFGPELVTRDELPEGCRGLGIRTVLNGDVMQEADTADLIFGVADLVATLSEAMTLTPGDVIVTGTPDGVGALRKPPVWLKPGDECTVEIDRIGALTNPVVQEAAGRPGRRPTGRPPGRAGAGRFADLHRPPERGGSVTDDHLAEARVLPEATADAGRPERTPAPR